MTIWKTALLTLLLAGATTAGLAAQSLELVSRVPPDQISDTGAAGADTPKAPPLSISDDGRYVVFVSRAANLVPGQRDVNSRSDVFLRDLLTGTTTLVSRSMTSPATTGNQGSEVGVISGDGRYVAFVSQATDLVPGQAGNLSGGDHDLLLYDRVTDTITLVAASPSEFSASFRDLAISADGRYLAFASDAADLVPGDTSSTTDVFLYDRMEGKILRISATAGSGWEPVISPDGRFVFFLTSNGFGVLDQFKAFLFDRMSGASIPLGPSHAAAFSADGRYLTFTAIRSLSLRDLHTGATTTLLNEEVDFLFSNEDPVVINSDGRYIASGTYLVDRLTGALRLAHGRALSISGDGRYVVFASDASDIVPGQIEGGVNTLDIFLFDRTTNSTALVSAKAGSLLETGNGDSSHPLLSRDGARIVFESYASNLVAGARDFNNRGDVYVHETGSGDQYLVSVRAPELPSLTPSARSAARALSADGRFVAFESDSTHLITGLEDANDRTDLFLYDTETKTTLLVSRAHGSPNRTADGRSVRPVISADGRYVLFSSNAKDLAPGPPDLDLGLSHLFLFDRITGGVRFVGTSEYPIFDNYLWAPEAMTPDGRWVAYTNYTSNLVPGLQEPEDGVSDIFLWDRVTGSTILVSRSVQGATVAANDHSASPALSADGRYVAFLSEATDLVRGQVDTNSSLDLFLFDRITGKAVLASRSQNSAVTSTKAGGGFSLSAEGRFLVFDASTGDSFSPPGVYLYDRTSGTRQLLDTPAFSPRISADGRYIAWLRSQPRDAQGNFVPAQLSLYDRVSKTLRPVTPTTAPGGSALGRVEPGFVLSGDGRYVAFVSGATYLVPGQVSAPGREGSDIFLFDRVSGSTVLASRSPASPVTAMGESENPLISASGLRLAFTSTAGLNPNDFNDLSDAYFFSLPASTGGPIPLPPCKLLDTRRRADRPALRSDTRRTVRAAGVCGVPATAKSVSVTVTALQATGKGNLRFYAGNDTVNSSGILRFEKNATRSAAFNLPLATNGAGTLAILPFVAGKGTVQVVVEVNGYSQ